MEGKALTKALKEARRTIEFPPGDYEMGIRFGSDERAIASVTRVATDEEILEDPLAWAFDALRDAASADYWYAYEKQWD